VLHAIAFALQSSRLLAMLYTSVEGKPGYHVGRDGAMQVMRARPGEQLNYREVSLPEAAPEGQNA